MAFDPSATQSGLGVSAGASAAIRRDPSEPRRQPLAATDNAARVPPFNRVLRSMRSPKRRAKRSAQFLRHDSQCQRFVRFQIHFHGVSVYIEPLLIFFKGSGQPRAIDSKERQAETGGDGSASSFE